MYTGNEEVIEMIFETKKSLDQDMIYHLMQFNPIFLNMDGGQQSNNEKKILSNIFFEYPEE